MKILILGGKPEMFFALAEKLRDAKTQVEVADFRDLGFLIDGEKTDVIICSTKESLKEYQQIWALGTSKIPTENYIFNALVCFCRKNGITVMDDAFSSFSGKMYAMWRFWEKDIPVPKTAFGPAEFLVEKLGEFGGIGVLKSATASQGKDNYLVKTGEEIRKIVAENAETKFILQNFIPNEGDFRIVVLDYKARMAIYRSANKDDHRNNTSLGGEAELVTLERVAPEILRLAEEAAKALQIRIAGSDILQNSETGEYFVLEANRTPQLASGAFVEEKMKVLRELI